MVKFMDMGSQLHNVTQLCRRKLGAPTRKGFGELVGAAPRFSIPAGIMHLAGPLHSGLQASSNLENTPQEEM